MAEYPHLAPYSRPPAAAKGWLATSPAREAVSALAEARTQMEAPEVRLNLQAAEEEAGRQGITTETGTQAVMELLDQVQAVAVAVASAAWVAMESTSTITRNPAPAAAGLVEMRPEQLRAEIYPVTPARTQQSTRSLLDLFLTWHCAAAAALAESADQAR